MFWVIKCFNHEVCIACNVSTHENKLSFQHIRPITIFVKFNNWRVHLVKLFKLFTPTSRHQMILKDIFAQLWIGTYLKSVISSYNEILLVMKICFTTAVFLANIDLLVLFEGQYCRTMPDLVLELIVCTKRYNDDRARPKHQGLLLRTELIYQPRMNGSIQLGPTMIVRK